MAEGISTPDTGGTMSVTEVTGLVNLFNGMLLSMEGRLIAKMDDNSRLAAERWVRHDAESVILVTAMTDRIIAVERDLAAHIEIANVHFNKAHDEDLVLQARVKPITTVAGYVVKNWKTIALVILVVLSFLGFAGENLDKILGN